MLLCVVVHDTSPPPSPSTYLDQCIDSNSERGPMHAVTSFDYPAARRQSQHAMDYSVVVIVVRRTLAVSSFDYVVSGFVLLVDVHFSYLVAAWKRHPPTANHRDHAEILCTTRCSQ